MIKFEKFCLKNSNTLFHFYADLQGEPQKYDLQLSQLLIDFVEENNIKVVQYLNVLSKKLNKNILIQKKLLSSINIMTFLSYDMTLLTCDMTCCSNVSKQETSCYGKKVIALY